MSFHLVMGLGTATLSLIGIALGAVAIKLNKEFEEAHQPQPGDNICHKCKKSCGSPVSSEQGYGNRSDKMKHTYYCDKCGRYYDVWR